MNKPGFAGHMARTLSQLKSYLKKVDILIECRDARAPLSSAVKLPYSLQHKPRLVVLTKSDLASDKELNTCLSQMKDLNVMSINYKKKRFLADLIKTARHCLPPTHRATQANHLLQVMVIGVPNVGKSTLINRLLGKKKAKAADQPGVTRHPQWITIDQHLMLLDTPGLLDAAKTDTLTQQKLSLIRAIEDHLIDPESVAYYLLDHLFSIDTLSTHYRLKDTSDSIEIFIQNLGRHRGYFSGKMIDEHKVYHALIRDFQKGILGKVFLD